MVDGRNRDDGILTIRFLLLVLVCFFMCECGDEREMIFFLFQLKMKGL